jgi:hypothetical protein
VAQQHVNLFQLVPDSIQSTTVTSPVYCNRKQGYLNLTILQELSDPPKYLFCMYHTYELKQQKTFNYISSQKLLCFLKAWLDIQPAPPPVLQWAEFGKCNLLRNALMTEGSPLTSTLHILETLTLHQFSCTVHVLNIIASAQDRDIV